MHLKSLITDIQSLDQHLIHKVASAVNTSLTLRNWLIGAYIVEYEQNGSDRAEYGEKLMPTIATLLQIKGLGITAIKQCRLFYTAYPSIRQTLPDEFKNIDHTLSLPIIQTTSGVSTTNPQKRQTLSDESPSTPTETIPALPPEKLLHELSFSHFVELLQIKDPLQRVFYEVEAIKARWSVRTLKRQVGSLLYERTGISDNKEKLLALTNDDTTQIEPLDLIRDPYIFEFLGLKSQEVVEEETLETSLIDHLQNFLLELGRGFCFEERQKKILIGEDHYFIDLVFYHRILKCHVLIELKVEPFTHANAGQLNTYLNWYRTHEMQEGDNPPVGILLCTDHKKSLAQYALGGMNENLFVSQYQLNLPDQATLQDFLTKEIQQLTQAGNHD